MRLISLTLCLLAVLSSLAFAPAPLPKPDRETPQRKREREVAALARRLRELGVEWRRAGGAGGGGRGRAVARTAPPKLLGSYSTPAFSYGDVVSCARRGDVRVVGLSEAPIPWPIGQTLPRGRARSLVLYGALAEAVRRESAEAV